jgi:hypothetical protein
MEKAKGNACGEFFFRKAESGEGMAWCGVVWRMWLWCGAVDMVGVVGAWAGVGARADSALCTNLESTRTEAWTPRFGTPKPLGESRWLESREQAKRED